VASSGSLLLHRSSPPSSMMVEGWTGRAKQGVGGLQTFPVARSFVCSTACQTSHGLLALHNLHICSLVVRHLQFMSGLQNHSSTTIYIGRWLQANNSLNPLQTNNMQTPTYADVGRPLEGGGGRLPVYCFWQGTDKVEKHSTIAEPDN